MIITTTPNVEGRKVIAYHGIVTGETIEGANFFKDMLASIRDVVGGRSATYESVLRRARDQALQEMAKEARSRGANAVVGVDIGYGALGTGESMLMVAASGTAVTIE